MSSERDPNLWTVKCNIGTEKETAVILMRKFLTLQYSDTVSVWGGGGAEGSRRDRGGRERSK